ncbi:MAG: aspartate/glutamate racemase family protein [Acetobacteraceae bacterium]
MTPRRLLVINPNTNPAITASLCAAVARHVLPGTRVVGRTGSFGAPVIATRASFVVAAHAALDAYAVHAALDAAAILAAPRADADDAEGGEAVDGIILGCFGDPGLAALREVASAPVVGLAEGSFAMASGPFAVLTAGAPWRGMLLDQLATLPQRDLCRGIWTLDATGADVAADPQGFVAAMDALAMQAVAAGAQQVILGGAVLAGYAPRLRPIAPFIDCVQAAIAHLATMTIPRRVRQPAPAIGLSPELTSLLAG